MRINRRIFYVLLPVWIGAGIRLARAQCTQQGQKLIGTPSSGAGLGWSVALSSDGNTAVAGAPFDRQGGAAYVYTRSHGVRAQQGPKLVGNGAAGAADLDFRGAFGGWEYGHRGRT